MVRSMNHRRPGSWKAALAIFVAAGAVLWHVLACTESPMSFSPGGDLALVTMEPYDEDDVSLAGPHLYRLMVISKDRRLRILEQSNTHMLTGPAYSSDGTRLCYLRIPLQTPQDQQRINKVLQARFKKSQEPTSRPAYGPWSTAVAPSPTSRPSSGEFQDLSLPSLSEVAELIHIERIVRKVPAELVIRDGVSGKVISSVPLEVIPDPEMLSEPDAIVMNAYVLSQPQFSPDAKWIYVWLLNMVEAVNPDTADRTLLAAGAVRALLSPDGKTLAVLQKESIGFISTDGQRAAYIRYGGKGVSLTGLAWMGNERLGVLRKGDGDKGQAKIMLDLVAADGSGVSSMKIPLEDTQGSRIEVEAGQLAVAPNGRHMVISFGDHVLFCSTAGKVIQHLQIKDQYLFQPAFSRDSKLVAFKSMVEGDDSPARVRAIAFYTPQGEALYEVPIPPIPAGSTQPAMQAADE